MEILSPSGSIQTLSKDRRAGAGAEKSVGSDHSFLSEESEGSEKIGGDNYPCNESEGHGSGKPGRSDHNFPPDVSTVSSSERLIRSVHSNPNWYSDMEASFKVIWTPD